MPPPSAQELIRAQRDGAAPTAAHLQAVVDGIAGGAWSDAQIAAWAMAVCLRGLDDAATAALTHAMAQSGEVLRWDAQALGGPVLDKHSTGGVGDKVSLLLAPIVAACGGFVPMVSGRGLGHTGGTLDKLESIPGLRTALGAGALRRTVAQAGCAIAGAGPRLAPADRRLYAVRDVTATVESVPLITASILSKKLAAGIQALVMDVKTGSGAFAADRAAADALAASIVRTAAGAGLPCRAFVTDMDQVLGETAGNALEVAEAVHFLRGTRREPRLLEVTRALAAELLVMGRLADGGADAQARVDAVLADGRAAERFARMVRAQGGPSDLVDAPHRHLPAAPAQRPVPAPADGWLAGCDVRGVGLALVALGAGRGRSGDRIDVRVGLSAVTPLHTAVRAGDAIAVVHAADEPAAARTAAALAGCFTVRGQPPLPRAAAPAGAVIRRL